MLRDNNTNREGAIWQGGLARVILVLLAVVAGALTLNSCSLYHQEYRPGDKAHFHYADTKGSYDLYYVESDDNGWFWEPAQANGAFDAVRKSAQGGDTIVVLFVAGWHHLAECCDDNVEGFKRVLMDLDSNLRMRMYQVARSHIHKDPPGPVHVIGIYMGWRGRSLPGFLDYASFFGRKSAAMRVGESDFREFLVRMRDYYQDRVSLVPKDPDPKLFGLITIGHSFGGQVVLRATSTFIEHELMQVGTTPAYLRVPPAPGAGPKLPSPIAGFGDLVVLINPAVEAAAYARLHSLGIGLQYADAQTPIMLTISADNDVPRKSYFPFGRYLGEWLTGAPRIADPRERHLERRALGFAEEQVTHRLEPVDKSMHLVGQTFSSAPEPTCHGHDHCEYRWFDWANRPPQDSSADTVSEGVYSVEALAAIKNHDFSGTTVLSDVVLKPIGGNIPHQALIVASASPEVIDGHNGMFSEPLVKFLTRYIGFTEAQRQLPLTQLQLTAPVGGQ